MAKKDRPQYQFTLRRLWWVGLQAGIISTLVNMLIATIVRVLLKVPKAFAPFTLLPLSSGGIVGGLGAASVFALLLRFVPKPVQIFWLISLGLLLASMRLPLRLLVTKSPRFVGANERVVRVLMVLHTVVAFTSVVLLTREVNKKAS